MTYVILSNCSGSLLAWKGQRSGFLGGFFSFFLLPTDERLDLWPISAAVQSFNYAPHTPLSAWQMGF